MRSSDPLVIVMHGVFIGKATIAVGRQLARLGVAGLVTGKTVATTSPM